MRNIYDENKRCAVSCHTNKEYWWMFINKKEQVEL
jgi:hypothetical protein